MHIGGEMKEIIWCILTMEYYVATKNDVYEILFNIIGKQAIYNA